MFVIKFYRYGPEVCPEIENFCLKQDSNRVFECQSTWIWSHAKNRLATTASSLPTLIKQWIIKYNPVFEIIYLNLYFNYLKSQNWKISTLAWVHNFKHWHTFLQYQTSNYRYTFNLSFINLRGYFLLLCIWQ